MKYFRRSLIFIVIVFIPYLLVFGFDFFFGIPGKTDDNTGVSSLIVFTKDWITHPKSCR